MGRRSGCRSGWPSGSESRSPAVLWGPGSHSGVRCSPVATLSQLWLILAIASGCVFLFLPLPPAPCPGLGAGAACAHQPAGFGPNDRVRRPAGPGGEGGNGGKGGACCTAALVDVGERDGLADGVADREAAGGAG